MCTDELAPLVDIRGVSRRFGARRALSNLDLTLRPGETFALLGANGSGKTTTLRILAGILAPSDGEGTVVGFDLRRCAAEIRGRIGYVSQRLALYGELTVRENVRFRAEVYGVPHARRAAEAALHEHGLEEIAAVRVKHLSGGWARRAQVAAALLHRPRLLLLDEPTVGLDTAARRELWRHFAAAARGGCGIVVSTHEAAEADRCNGVVVFSDGGVVSRRRRLAGG